ncbi:hypothetical protein [Methylobacterium persicinum]|uniref:Uncharacterized protein n=1 Tax=Methylobacterium persicinum TaxID=374426 RepID=A0ABU0HL29_9HYPH|nr:hypothetical protein [Methylobacterium persicinum]MDQ0443027.1 hypothetical protein [Methylobacterium persicinum]GJE39056.1 hypothetical protein KHHGKMAE_3135 [Methylobacterium persicinum]
MDAETAKTLVSAALVSGIALFSLVSFRAVLVQVAEDLKAARRVPVRVQAEARRAPHRPEA